jgi:tripartite-type tricarboxylate transporter receptor subunit TctC
LRTPAAREKFAELGVEAAPLPYAEFDAFFRAEVAKWRQVIERAGIRVE